MSITATEKKQLKKEIITELKAEASDVLQLEEVTSLAGVRSFPAVRGEKPVSVPLSLFLGVEDLIVERNARETGDQTTLESAQRYTDTNIAVERSDRESSDATTLQAAKSYTDATAASERVESEAADRQTLADAKAYVDAAIEQLVNGSPAALDTLKELSDALGNDPNFAATITNALAGKVDKVAGKGLSAEDFTTALKAKLAAIDDYANNYTHPSSHPASMIQEDATRRFVSDSEKTSWNGAVSQLGDIAAALDKING